MSMYYCCCGESTGLAPTFCLGCEDYADPTAFRVDFPEITYAASGLTDFIEWDNGLARCNGGYRQLSASREFPDISDFGNGTIMLRETQARTPCAWGHTDATLWGSRRLQVTGGSRCDCSSESASVYGGVQLGPRFDDWQRVGQSALDSVILARPADCGTTGSCGDFEQHQVSCADIGPRLGVRCGLGASATTWFLSFEWAQIANISWSAMGSGGFATFTTLALMGNLGAREFSAQGFSGSDVDTAYAEVFNNLWPGTTRNTPSTGSMQWNYQAPRTCDHLDGSPFVLTLNDQAAVNARFARNGVNPPPASVSLVAL